MAIRADSYSSTGEVRAFTRHLLDGQTTFNSTTRPTLTEVEKFIDRVSATLNVALEDQGFGTPVTNSTAKLLLDDWVTAEAVAYVELTQRGQGYSEGESTRERGFKGLHNKAETFVDRNAKGFKRIGLTVDHKKSEGLVFTGETARADRVDPDDSSLEQPFFGRRLFDITTDDTDDDD